MAMSRDELIHLVKRIRYELPDQKCMTDEEIDELIGVFEANVVHPAPSDLMFRHERLSAEEVVDRALAYKPIPMPPAQDKPPNDGRSPR